MITELQNKVWLVLPKEFKEEVKKLYSRFLFTREGYYDELFGKHNLTSDAEGEEMLTVSRKKVQELYSRIKHSYDNVVSDNLNGHYGAMIGLLKNLFGSKCLPDDRDNLSPEPKPAEPKFKVGDYVRYKGDVQKVVATTKDNRCYLNKILGSIDESELEPYTEPEEPTCTRTCTDDCPSQSRNLSQETANCDKRFDNVLKDSFSKERRLNIAAMAMQGLLASPVDANMQSKSVDYIVKASFEYADALIAESEKGGAVGNS